MVLNRKEFAKLAVSMGIAKRLEVKTFFNEFPKEEYDDDKDIIRLWRMAEACRRWKQTRPGKKYNDEIRILPIRRGGY